MNPTKKYEWILQKTREYPESNVFYKEDWDAICFFVAGKLFGYLADHNEKGWILTLKGKPNQNQELREEYPFIEAGYHMNKIHWVTILLDHEDVKDQMITTLLDHSYQLIFAGLSKKMQAQILGK